MSIVEQLKVLVVDDMTTSRMLIIEALQEIGFRQISFAKNGEDGLKMVQSNPVHMVISDFEMPTLDGIGFLQGIRSNPATRNIPFIMVTGRGDRALVERASKFGLNNYLTKPFTVASMRTALRAVLKGI